MPSYDPRDLRPYEGELLLGRFFIWEITHPEARGVVQLLGQRPGAAEKEIHIRDVASGDENWVGEKRFREACVLLAPLTF
jgi:hypothetical protein